MPSRTPAQARLMAAACHGRTRTRVPRAVACEFFAADRALAKKEAESDVDYLKRLSDEWEQQGGRAHV